MELLSRLFTAERFVLRKVLAHVEYVFELIADGLIESHDVPVTASYLKIDLGTAHRKQSLFGRLHHLRGYSPASQVGIGGKVIDPPSVALISGHAGGNKLALDLSHKEELGVDPELPLYVLPGIVPGNYEIAAKPEVYYILLVSGLERPYDEILTHSSIHQE